MINDLTCGACCIKYVDDVTIVAVSDDPMSNHLQSAVSQLNEWCQFNNLNLNVQKIKEMIFYFGKSFDITKIPILNCSDMSFDRVDEFKLLGVVFRSDLNWSSHVKYILTKASRRIFVISMLLRSGMSVRDVLTVYTSIIRSILEYASPVWHCGLTQTQSAEIEKIQRRCLKIIFPSLSYKEAISLSKLERLSDRREKAAHALFDQIKQPSHILNNLLTVKVIRRDTRDTYPFVIPCPKTNRLYKSLINYGLSRRW